MKATEEVIEKVRQYFEWQAPDLEVTFMQSGAMSPAASRRDAVGFASRTAYQTIV